MPYLKKVVIKGKGYFYLFHTVRDGEKFRKLSRYLGKEEPSKEELKKLKEDFINKIKGKAKIEIEEKPRINILETLHEIQNKYGYLPEDNIRTLSKKIGIPVVEIYDTASFYSMFSFEKKAKNIVRVCNSPSCYLNGSLNVLEEARKLAKGKFTVELASCIGCCDKAPAVMINNELITNITKAKLKQLLK